MQDGVMLSLIDRDTVADLLTPPGLVDALDAAFRKGCIMPPRHHHTVHVPGAADATLLLMPCWMEGGMMGVKAANIFPGNAAAGVEAVSALYLLFDAANGAPLAVMDGGELTARRTAATSALAARYLAREDARTHLVVGTGRLSRHLARAHRETRPCLEQTLIWGRDPGKAAAVAADLRSCGLRAEEVTDLKAAVAAADIVSCATLSTTPLVRGAWRRPGQHFDLVGSFTPAMREVDDDLLRSARIVLDTLSGAAETGDIAQPLSAGVIARDLLQELAALVRGDAAGRQAREEITVFKSVGAAIEDLAAALLVLERFNARRTAP